MEAEEVRTKDFHVASTLYLLQQLHYLTLTLPPTHPIKPFTAIQGIIPNKSLKRHLTSPTAIQREHNFQALTTKPPYFHNQSVPLLLVDHFGMMIHFVF